jgi:hypothetical protein
MEPEGSLLCSQEPTTGSYPEPDESRPDLTTLIFQDSPSYSDWLCGPPSLLSNGYWGFFPQA